MDNIEFISIAKYELISSTITTQKTMTKITLNKDFKKGLVELNNFSHCIIFTHNKESIFCYETKVLEVNVTSGELLINETTIQGEIIDIKPCLPCEDRVKAIIKKQQPVSIPFNGNFIGEYLFKNNTAIIQFHESKSLTSKEIQATLELIKKGDYVRILWYFHKFDKKEYRNICMCTPPYENAPKSGVFATRSPVRPNPIASTVVKVEDVHKNNHQIKVCGFDGFENTMILQVMSYNSSYDNIKVPKWAEHFTEHK
ncbi:MAG: TrmO family methyltransferase [Vallitalea sp.]|jgi:excinuclease ABC subunit A|nr:TrmO family methyltransferase [Vallitalea sp.]